MVGARKVTLYIVYIRVRIMPVILAYAEGVGKLGALA